MRVRPPISSEVQHGAAVFVDSDTGISVSTDKHDISCRYDKVFQEISSQQNVFDEVSPLLLDVLKGFNACIFAYGQTSAGKTHTMLGPDGGQELSKINWGVLPRSADMLFSDLEKKSKAGLCTYKVTASFLQIYNENIYDLLRKSTIYNDDFSEDTDNHLKIREVPKPKGADPSEAHEVYVSGLSEFRVQTADDVLELIALGSANRATRSTDFNATSSRSHAILQLNFEINQKDDITGREVISRSKLSLVDLAGSEKMQISQEPTERHLKELTSINKSLSSLGNVISALSSSSRSHIPYRDSKLTRLLQDSLGGNTRTVLIACVAPTILHVAESISTLQFADRAKSVMLRVKANTTVDDKALLISANAEIARLKQLLAHALKRKEEGIIGGGSMGSSSEEDESLLVENMRLKEENLALREVIRKYEEGPPHVIERDRRGRVKPVKQRKGDSNVSNRQILKPVKSTTNLRTSQSASHLRNSTQNAMQAALGSGENDNDGQNLLQFGSGRVRPVPMPNAKLDPFGVGGEISEKKKGKKKQLMQQSSSSSSANPSLHPLHNSGLYGNGNLQPLVHPRSQPSAGDLYGSVESVDGLGAAFLQKLHADMLRPRSKTHLREIRMNIDNADTLAQQKLREEEQNLNSIQAMKRSLERKLAELSAVNNDGDADKVIENNARSSVTSSPLRRSTQSPMKSFNRDSPSKRERPTNQNSMSKNDQNISPLKIINKALSAAEREDDNTLLLKSPSPSKYRTAPGPDTIEASNQQWNASFNRSPQQSVSGESSPGYGDDFDEFSPARSPLRSRRGTPSRNSLSSPKRSLQRSTDNTDVRRENVSPGIERFYNEREDRKKTTAVAVDVNSSNGHIIKSKSPSPKRIATSLYGMDLNMYDEDEDNYNDGDDYKEEREGQSRGHSSPSKSLAVSTSSADSSEKEQPLQRTGTAGSTAAGVTYSMEDRGKVVQMFSFRHSTWDDLEILDYEPSKCLHKCQLSDGSTQWMDLKKKPIRKK